ncbi:MAG: helix-turn-helix domain-containing protein [Defluviitaleaceae bacterium]|nr:helix-turn-helix domain-containing protein [Defluviitaleaceae bacterium]
MADSIIDRLVALKEWQFYDIRILASSVGYAADYKTSNALAERAIAAIEHFKDDKDYQYINFAIHFNIATRIVRARYFDIESDANKEEEIKEQERLFTKHFNAASAISKAGGMWVSETVLLIMKGLFKKDYSLVDENLKLLQTKGARDAWKMMRNIVNEYNVLVGSSISAIQLNVLIGSNIRKIREHKGLSMDDIADMTGMTSSHIGLLERGDRGASVLNLYKLADALGVSWEMILKGSGLSSKEDLELEVQRQRLMAMIPSMQKDDLIALNEVAERLCRYSSQFNRKPLQRLN